MRITFLLLLLLSCGLGCKPKNSSPTALPVEQLPAALEKAFATAPAEAKELATQLIASIKAQDYSKAHPQMQALGATPHLTPEQLNITARGLLTLNDLLQAAEAQGDKTAAQALQNYRANK